MYFSKEYEEEQSCEDWEQEILDTCDYELIKSKLGKEVADSLFLY